MRWFVEISALGKNPPPATTLCVEAPQWQPALQKARALRGDDGSMTNFSIELLDDGYRAIDPTARLRYVVRKAPDDAALTSNGAAGPAAAPRPANGKKSGKPGTGRKTPLPPKAVGKTPAPPAAASAPPRGRSIPPCKVLSERSQEPSAKSPLTYRELAYAVPEDTSDEMADALIVQRFEHIRDKMPVRPGRMINLAVFDHEFTGKPQRPPLATLTWKDWKGDAPEIRFPRRDGPGNTPTPLAPFSAPPPSLMAALGAGPQAPESSSRTVEIAATKAVADAPAPSTPPAATSSAPRPTDTAAAPPSVPTAKATLASSAPTASPSTPAAMPSAAPAPDARATTAAAPPATPAGPTSGPPSAAPASAAPATTASAPAPSSTAPATATSAPPAAPAAVVSAPPSAPASPPAVSAGAPTAPAPAIDASAAKAAPAEEPPPPTSSAAPTVQMPAREQADALRDSVAPATEPTAASVSPSNAPSTQPSRDTTPGSPPIPGFSATPTPSAEIVEEVSVPVDVTDTPAKATPEPAAAAAPAAPAAAPSRPAPTSKPPKSKQPPRPVQRLAGDELLAELFEAFHDLHFLGDALAGADFVLALVHDKLPAEVALVSFFDINKREFVVVRQDGGDASAVLTRFPERAPIAQSAMRSHRAVVVSDAAADPRVGADARFKAIGVDVTSVVCAPVEVGGRYLGVVELLNPLDGGRFTDGDGHAMTYIGQQFAEFVAQHGVVVDPEAILATASKGHRR